jgi:hypothetical protein
MTHPIHRVKAFRIVGPYTLAMAFTDGTEQRIDFRPVLHGELFGPLEDVAVFNARSSTQKPVRSCGRTGPRARRLTSACSRRREAAR